LYELKSINILPQIFLDKADALVFSFTHEKAYKDVHRGIYLMDYFIAGADKKFGFFYLYFSSISKEKDCPPHS